jgi:hypothetical protein
MPATDCIIRRGFDRAITQAGKFALGGLTTLADMTVHSGHLGRFYMAAANHASLR